MNLVYSHEVFTQQVVGGVSRYFVELIKRMQGEEGNLKVHALGGLFINKFLREVSGVRGVKVPPLRYTGFFRRMINSEFQRLCIKYYKPDLVHQTYYSDFIFEKGQKVVLTVPDMIHELYPESFFDNGNTSILKERCCERADKIIAISHTTKSDLVRLFGIDPGKIQVISLANPLGGVLPDSSKRALSANYILYVGDRHGYKNFNKLVQGYSNSTEIRKKFHLVCFGGGVFSPDERIHFKALGIERNLIQLSGNDRLLAHYYQNARAFVYPSLYEGFGLPVLEAMSYGCPVICSNKGSIPEVAGEAGIYFDPESVDEIQSVLEKSLFDDSVLKEYSRLGIERNKQFSWDKCAGKTLKVYQSLGEASR